MTRFFQAFCTLGFSTVQFSKTFAAPNGTSSILTTFFLSVNHFFLDLIFIHFPGMTLLNLC